MLVFVYLFNDLFTPGFIPYNPTLVLGYQRFGEMFYLKSEDKFLRNFNKLFQIQNCELLVITYILQDCNIYVS
jgi:hypothetical protein